MSARRIRGGVTAARGFAVGTAEAGLRSRGGDDLVLLASVSGPAAAAATFTTNRFRAAPVLVAESALQATGGRVRGLVVNAGSANAGTGPGGIDDARSVVAAAATRLDCAPDEVLPASTGLIGSRLAVQPMIRALGRMRLSSSLAAGTAAARAIMTTDTHPKQHAVACRLGDGREILVGGMAKGAGMIHPQMATMLAFLTTDAPVEPPLLAALLRGAVDRSFNQVSVDGDTSTNDAVILLASGAAGGPTIIAGSEAEITFAGALDAVCHELATAIAADGEGARSVIEVAVHGALDERSARAVARTVASSNLVKAAVHGADPNWGRIAAAAGRSGVALDMDRLRVSIGDDAVFAGEPLPFDERRVRRALRARHVRLTLDLGLGDGVGRAWGCDLSPEYVTFNSEYTT